MERMLALFSAVLLAAPWSAIACSYWTPTPEQSAQGMENAVIAYPIGISNVPGQGADASFRGEFRQTIKWVVLVKWRGSHPLGKIFTTREHIDQSGMCGRQGIFDAKPRLLLFNGSEPYRHYDDYTIDRSPEMFQYFQRTQIKNGT